MKDLKTVTFPEAVDYLNGFKANSEFIEPGVAETMGIPDVRGALETKWRDTRGLLVVHKDGMCSGIVLYPSGDDKVLTKQKWTEHALKSYLYWVRKNK